MISPLCSSIGWILIYLKDGSFIQDTILYRSTIMILLTWFLACGDADQEVPSTEPTVQKIQKDDGTFVPKTPFRQDS